MAYLDVLNKKHPAYYVTAVHGIVAPRNNEPISDVPLSEKREKFMAHVKNGYSHSTVVNYQWCVNTVIKEGSRGFYTYNQLLARYSQKRNIRCYLLQIMMYDFYDILPSAGRLDLHTVYYKLSQKNQQFVDELMECLIAKNISPRRVNIEASSVAKFLHFAEESGAADIYDVTDQMIRDYALLGFGSNAIIHGIGCDLAYYAEMLSDEKLKQIAGWFPKLHKGRKVYTPLLSSEREKLENYLTDPASDLSKRDRAIGILLFYTGLRSIDVRLMKPSDIDLKNEQIHVIQHKTGVHVRIPLRPIVSNAIVDYVKNERPQIKYPYLFIPDRIIRKHKVGPKPHCCNVTKVINRLYDKVGIRQDGARRGTHLLRHAVSDKMLNEGTDVAIISRILGHTDPDTTFNYVNANIDQLRACALPIDDYPIKSKLYEE